MRRAATAVVTIALTLVAFVGPAIAGGWAVTTLDALPGEFVAGTSYTLGYTIRQHGVTPVNVEHTEIVATGRSGRTLSFPGAREGATGHYVATVSFPAEGSYAWHVTQTPFGPQELGTLVVVAASGAKGESAAGPVPARASNAASDPVRAALPFAAAVAGLLFGWRVLDTLRRLRRGGATA